MSHDVLPDPVTLKMIDFLRSIGLGVRIAPITEPVFVPGIFLEAGALVVDPANLAYPGDLLHEAGHLAIATPERRATITGDAGSDPAEEMMAIGWSYAAAVHLQLDPAVVFHPAGYRGGSANLLDNFTHGRYLGVPMLQWVGMTLDEHRAQAAGVLPYPHMLRWLR